MITNQWYLMNTLWHWVSRERYWFIYDGTGSVWVITCWYLLVLDQYRAVLGHYKAVRAESIWVSGRKSLKQGTFEVFWAWWQSINRSNNSLILEQVWLISRKFDLYQISAKIIVEHIFLLGISAIKETPSGKMCSLIARLVILGEATSMFLKKTRHWPPFWKYVK